MLFRQFKWLNDMLGDQFQDAWKIMLTRHLQHKLQLADDIRQTAV